jgi:Cytochrome c oxidase subunit VII
VGVFVGWGELVVNLPFSRFKSLKPVYFVIGAISALALMYARPTPRRPSPRAIYLATYLFMLACWPHDSPRLWMPVIPLLIAGVASTLRRFMRGPRARLLVGVYLAWFAVTGLAALAYTTRISFSKSEFLRVYGNNGGLASPGTPGRPRNPVDVRRYNEAARNVLMRYGGQQIEPQ